jgi:hypothetical protein
MFVKDSLALTFYEFSVKLKIRVSLLELTKLQAFLDK